MYVMIDFIIERSYQSGKNIICFYRLSLEVSKKKKIKNKKQLRLQMSIITALIYLKVEKQKMSESKCVDCRYQVASDMTCELQREKGRMSPSRKDSPRSQEKLSIQKGIYMQIKRNMKRMNESVGVQYIQDKQESKKLQRKKNQTKPKIRLMK